MSEKLYAAHGNGAISLNLSMANRHGLIAGATGTGKTVSLQVLAEAFSAAGVSVFMADMKGDLSGIAKAGQMNKKIAERVEKFGIGDFSFEASPVCFLDVFGKQGHPLRTTVSEIGPLLLSRLLNLNEVQAGTLNIVFRIADENGWLLIDMKDLRSMLDYAGKNAAQYTTSYGNISSASIGAIQRGLLTLESQGGNIFLGEPDFKITDLLRTRNGRGIVSVLAADSLMQTPVLYSTLLLWLLSELYENLPEEGDIDKPKLVFFFDEAHLLFNGAPKVLVEKLEQIVRLIRSKAVGVYFISQSPQDIPDSILGQLGNRIQHALRAYTPKDQKAVKTAAQTFRPNPAINTEEAITSLAVGEALVSFLDEQGRPSIVERAFMLPPHSQIGPITADERAALNKQSELAGKYDNAIDRESAFEILKANSEKEAAKNNKAASLGTTKQAPRPQQGRTTGSSTRRSANTGADIANTVAKSFARTIGSTAGRQLIRGVLGSLLR
jgi:DNA helicase HerA-like ATPase